MSVEKMSIVRVLVNYFGRVIECFFAFLFFYLTFAIYGSAITVGSIKDSGDIALYVQSNGIHTDVVLPTKTEHIDWRTFISIDAFGDDTPQEYIAIGWGDKGFFLDTPTWGELTLSTAVNAAFLPSATAMHVMYMKEPEISETRRKIYVSSAAYKKMIRKIKSTFKKRAGIVDLIKNRGYTPHDNFYEAYDSYHCFRTCNCWTNEVLKEGGVKTGAYALFPFGIINPIKE